MTPDGFGIGASAPRKEDARLLHGRGCFVSDITMPGLQDVAFLRSPVAHANIRARRKPAGHETTILFRDDLTNVAPIVTRSAMPGYKLSEFHPLAAKRVRFVGEPIALCIAATRAEAEDLTELVDVDYEELPAIASSAAGRKPNAVRLHEHWSDNLFLETSFDSGIDVRCHMRPSRSS